MDMDKYTNVYEWVYTYAQFTFYECMEANRPMMPHNGEIQALPLIAHFSYKMKYWQHIGFLHIVTNVLVLVLLFVCFWISSCSFGFTEHFFIDITTLSVQESTLKINLQSIFLLS